MTRRADPEYVTAFFKAVYPEYTELAVATAHTEKRVLTDATETINDLRTENAALRRRVTELEAQLHPRDEGEYQKGEEL